MVESNLGNSEDNGIGTNRHLEAVQVFNLISTKMGTWQYHQCISLDMLIVIYKYKFPFSTSSE
jgi:hypothetical protein